MLKASGSIPCVGPRTGCPGKVSALDPETGLIPCVRIFAFALVRQDSGNEELFGIKISTETGVTFHLTERQDVGRPLSFHELLSALGSC